MLNRLKQQWLKHEDGFDNPISQLKIKLKNRFCGKMQTNAERGKILAVLKAVQVFD